jgi:hypothetical protein
VVGLITPWVSIGISKRFKLMLLVPIITKLFARILLFGGLVVLGVILVPVTNNWVPRGPLLTGVTVSERATTEKVVVAAGTVG